ncbi:DUF262 domain-containing protein [Paenibacillus glacialis]|uniref:GmrSD restriction endonucleases N-terminal domain-containing protein n=1 Tax=Paenibacillus glacialis TaxID=494026 RepID=A0A168C2I0_9BACL|nr:DUF262 domain-containing protein [Paenibacillus glacialis]OAB32988.1 hypothetical protein PGLA_26275 [Paenibacillus glacialis]
MINNINSYSFWKLITNFSIEIPIIQRDYAQGRENDKITEIRNGFLDNLYDALIQDKHLDLDFVYGNLQDNEVFIPLDGQQRLTTLFLLHWYLAVKEGKRQEASRFLINFSYETRTSSREFCNALVNDESVKIDTVELDKLFPVSSQIKNAPWFFISWKRDPTIKSMLVMIDAIHERFKYSDLLFTKLTNSDSNLVSFQFIKLENFGLEDSLYIKMNARGKALTSFENFKAKFEQLLTEKEEKSELIKGFTKEYANNIDSKWTDLFWCYRDPISNLFDDQIMNFIRAMVINNYALMGNYELDNRLNYLIEYSKHVSFVKYNEFASFDSNVIHDITIMLDSLYNSDGNKIKTYLIDRSLIDENILFDKIIRNSNITYTDRIRFYALSQFFKQNQSNIDSEQLYNWIRVIRNLSEYTQYNNVRDFVRSIRSIAQIISESSDILHFLIQVKNADLGFLGEQVEEERIKAVLILKSNRWEKAVIEAENHGYFKGQISFLLKFSNILFAYRNGNKELNWTAEIDDEYYGKFIEYFKKASAVFNNSGLEANHDLWRRALLCKGDYLLSNNLNRSFLIDSHRDISWKRLLRENEKRDFVQNLLDDIDTQNISASLQKVIDNSNVDDWRKYFIKYPYLIEEGCGANKYIRMKSNRDILLLNSSTTGGYCKEYYTYALYLELKKNNYIPPYIDSRGVDYLKFIEFKSNNTIIQIMYEWDYVVEVGGKKIIFIYQEEVLDYLKSQRYIK